MMEEKPELPMARPERPRIVFAICKPAHFPEAYRTACGMLRSGRFLPVILFIGDRDIDFDAELNLCEEAGLNYIVDPNMEKLGHVFENKSKAGATGKKVSQASFVSGA